MKTAFLLVLSVIPLGRLLNYAMFESAGKVVPLSLLDLLIFGLVVWYAWGRISSGAWPLRGVPNIWAIAIFPAWAFLSLVVNVFRFGLSFSEGLFSGLYLVRWIEFSLLYFVAFDVLRTKKEIKSAIHILMFGSAAFCIFGFFQAAFFDDFALVLHPDAIPYVDYDPQGHRLVSTILDPNIAAGYLLPFVLLPLTLFLHGFKEWWPLFAIGGAALLLTLSRGGILGLCVGSLLVMVRYRPSWKQILAVLLVGAAVGGIAYQFVDSEIISLDRLSLDDASALARIEDWFIALEIARDNWFFGIGFNTFGYVSGNYAAERDGAMAFGLTGDPFMLLALTGTVGVLSYIILVRRMHSQLVALENMSRDPWEKALARGIRASTIATIVSSFFTSIILYPHIMALQWVLWAIGARLASNTERTQRAKSKVPAQWNPQAGLAST